MIRIDKSFEYWTRWKNLEVTPTTAPYFRANKSLYGERLKELHKLRDEIVAEDIPSFYKDPLLQQVFDSITVLGRAEKSELEEFVDYGTAFAAGVVTGAVGKEVVSNMLKSGNDEKQA